MIQVKQEPLDDTQIVNELDILDRILKNNINDIDLNVEEDKLPLRPHIIQQQEFSLESFFKQHYHSSVSLKRKHAQQKIASKSKQVPHDVIKVKQVEPIVEVTVQHTCEHEQLKPNDEDLLLTKLNSMNVELSKTSLVFQQSVARLRCKLTLRKLKRNKRLKLFDIDAYTNELIDSEKTSSTLTTPCKNLDDIEVISSTSRVLDRFSCVKKKDYLMFNNGLSIGLVEYRNEDVKCLISPYSSKLLKPYIRRDTHELPLRLRLHKELVEKFNSQLEREPIDYVYLRPEHVLVINSLCKQHFWNGIDVSGCLQYPDYTIVALYKKLIIGFALMTPNSATNENYLSFIFVHSDWRSSSIAKYMMFRLLSLSQQQDVLLHVSVNSTAVLFYQKFGFKIEEYIEKFYDKYYSDEDHYYLSKDAFQMRLSK